ncbi:hypothetical protein BpHYR1_020545 [Brachionus plicatilis]|uniref:Uncharacterized protein n=1 Tax=Brachionus plicatilis TaxID=10195 RepID=A0A3M7S7Z5_BRAPC|nr:hypothetical protein BpHYR1_020545 [Brachionus plicatilis]
MLKLIFCFINKINFFAYNNLGINAYLNLNKIVLDADRTNRSNRRAVTRSCWPFKRLLNWPKVACKNERVKVRPPVTKAMRFVIMAEFTICYRGQDVD